MFFETQKVPKITSKSLVNLLEQKKTCCLKIVNWSKKHGETKKAGPKAECGPGNCIGEVKMNKKKHDTFSAKNIQCYELLLF